jgi:hypothetical protein
MMSEQLRLVKIAAVIFNKSVYIFVIYHIKEYFHISGTTVDQQIYENDIGNQYLNLTSQKNQNYNINFLDEIGFLLSSRHQSR